MLVIISNVIFNTRNRIQYTNPNLIHDSESLTKNQNGWVLLKWEEQSSKLF